MGVTWLLLAACAIVCINADRGGSSLRGALEALQRRQRGRIHETVIPSNDYEALYEFVPPQNYPEPDYALDVDDIVDEHNPKYIVKLLDNNERHPESYEYKLIKKKDAVNTGLRKESAFRERTHNTDNDKLRDLFMDKNEDENKKESPDVVKNDAEYALLLGQLWSKYKYNKVHASDSAAAPEGVVKLYKDKIVKKRYPDNWGPIAFKRKRSSESDINRPIVADYETRKQDEGIVNSNYDGYDLPEEDMLDEYAIAFQPMDEDNLSDSNDEDQYTYDTIEKRFPVSKRSSGPYDFGIQKKRFTQNQNKRDTVKSFRSSAGTDPKILKDLSKVFGESEVDIIKSPVKRSSDHVDKSPDVKPPTVLDHYNNTLQQNISQYDEDSHEHHGHNIHHPGISGKETPVEHDHQHKHDHGHNRDNGHKHSHNQELKPVDKPIIVKKKSVDWSDYFGIDKRTNKPIAYMNDLTQDRLRKQYFDTFNKEVIYPLNSFRKHSYAKRNFIQTKSNDQTEEQLDRTQSVADQNDNKRNSRENDSKLDNIDKKLKNMEGLIVDEALHYSNVGDRLDSKEEQEMKEKLLSRLAAAYSLEKMRKALKEFKQSIQTQKSESAKPSVVPTDEAKAKRVAVKKELIETNAIPAFNKESRIGDFEEEQGAGHYLNGKMEEFSEGYMGGSGRHRIPIVTTGGASGSCPVLAKIVQRCRGVDLLAGDRGQLFLPLCSLHQICYLCGEAPPTTCDLVFLSEADTTCEGDMGCQRAARSALMALRELHDNLADELDGECESSPCLQATLKLNVGWQRAPQR